MSGAPLIYFYRFYYYFYIYIVIIIKFWYCLESRYMRCNTGYLPPIAFMTPVNIVGWVDVVDVRELVLFSDARRC